MPLAHDRREAARFLPLRLFRGQLHRQSDHLARDNLLMLYKHIETMTGMGWMEAICRQWHLSEYILYGVFVEHVLNGRGHFFEKSNHCAVSWGREIHTEEGMEGFLSSVEPEQCAVMVSSKQYIPVSFYSDKLKRFEQVSSQIR